MPTFFQIKANWRGKHFFPIWSQKVVGNTGHDNGQFTGPHPPPLTIDFLRSLQIVLA